MSERQSSPPLPPPPPRPAMFRAVTSNERFLWDLECLSWSTILRCQSWIEARPRLPVATVRGVFGTIVAPRPGPSCPCGSPVHCEPVVPVHCSYCTTKSPIQFVGHSSRHPILIPIRPPPSFILPPPSCTRFIRPSATPLSLLHTPSHLHTLACCPSLGLPAHTAGADRFASIVVDLETTRPYSFVRFLSPPTHIDLRRRNSDGLVN